MPLIDDPSVGQSLLTPRGFIPLPGSDEATVPIKPPEEPKPEPVQPPPPLSLETIAPIALDSIMSIAESVVRPGSFGNLLFGNETGQAALRESNTIVSAIARAQETHGVSNELVDPNYSPWEDVAGTKYEKYWKNVFVESNNRQFTEALKRSIDRQENDRRTVAAGGLQGTIAGIVAGTIDPTILIPVGGEIRLAQKGIWTLARGVGQGARAGAVGATAYELGLQASQDIRSVQESAINIGTGTVLGAVLGGVVAGALTRTQRVASEAGLEKIAEMPVPGSAGAAATQKMSLDDLTIYNKITENLAAGTAFSPNLRGNFRESPLARQTYQEIATNVLRQNMHGAGQSLGASVETNINVSLGETLGQALEKYPAFYQQGKKSGFGMSRDIFDNAVGMAMRRGDVGVNDHVSNAAKMWRSQVVEPLTKQAIELDMLPADVKVEEAPSYFMRQYNTEKMTAQRPQFISTAQEHFHGILQNEYVRSVGQLQTRQADLVQELELLRMKPKVRAKKLAELKALKDDAKAQKLASKFDELDDPKARIAEIEAKQREATRKFLDTWEIKRLGEGVDLADPANIPDFSRHAKDMADEVYDSIVGNDWGSASVDPQFHLAAKSGPLKDRTFHIPDEKIEDFLESNVVNVMTRFARTMAAQVELARKFPGDPLLTNRFQQIKREYDALIETATSEKARQKLDKDMKATFRDLRALLEIHRGSYRAKENASSWGRLARGLMQFNFIRLMGGAAIPSLADIYGPAIHHGIGRTMSAGVPHLLDAATKVGPLVKEAKYAGVAERFSHHRLLTLAEIGDPYAQGTAVERLLNAGTHLGAKLNGLTMLTDFQKVLDAHVVMDRLNESLLKGTDDKFLAYSGMGPDMRTKVRKQLEQHSEEIDGIRVANTDQWEDWDAVRAYRAAINFNVNADIVTRGIGDVPLFAYHPLGKLLLQFKTFSMAAHQRTLLRASQLGPAQFMSGLIGLTTIGMMTTYMKAWRGGKENFERFHTQVQNNPGYWIAEGLDTTGFFTLPLEISNIAEKASGRAGYAVNPVKLPIMLGGKLLNPDADIQANTQAYAGRKSIIEATGGPSVGLIEDIAVGPGGLAVDVIRGDEPTRGTVNAANRVVPYQSYIGMRELIQIMQGNSPYLDE